MVQRRVLAKQRGQAPLPDPEIIGVESFDSCLKDIHSEIYCASESSSQVGKAGLPPLLVSIQA